MSAVTAHRVVAPWLAIAAIVATAAAGVSAQLLDRIVARVNGAPITWTDVQAARGLGLADVPEGREGDEAAVQQLIDRALMLAEVSRFPPPEPAAAAIDAQVAEWRAHAGAGLAQLVESTGTDERRIRELARDTLRIQAYLEQRFGSTTQVSDRETEEYFQQHPDEFRRNGQPMSFEEAAPEARRRAGAQRRASAIAQWLRDLRRRADIYTPSPDATILPPQRAGSRAN